MSWYFEEFTGNGSNFLQIGEQIKKVKDDVFSVCNSSIRYKTMLLTGIKSIHQHLKYAKKKFRDNKLVYLALSSQGCNLALHPWIARDTFQCLASYLTFRLNVPSQIASVLEGYTNARNKVGKLKDLKITMAAERLQTKRDSLECKAGVGEMSFILLQRGRCTIWQRRDSFLRLMWNEKDTGLKD